MGMDEAALPLHDIVVSLLCILPIIKEEEVSCLVGVVEVDVQNHDSEDGEGSGNQSTKSALSDRLISTEMLLYLSTSDVQYFLKSVLYFIHICML